MSQHDDLLHGLPDAPPPRPAQRRAAIDQAMARFDGIDTASAPPARSPRSWVKGYWPQLSALTTVALVAVLTVSLPRPGDDRGEPVPSRASPDQAAQRIQVPSPSAQLEPEPRAEEQIAAQAVPATKPSPRTPATDRDATVDRAVTDAPAPSPVMAAASPTPAAFAPSTQAARSTVSERAAADTRDAPEEGIVVTGRRVAGEPRTPVDVRITPRARVAADRGDWNACTIEDPARSIAACRALVDPGAPGSKGRADAQIADGLSKAWAGNAQAAIAAFDRAVELGSTSSLVYLNRGLARERSGDLSGALFDLNKAVRLSPRSARAYYHRSLIREQNRDGKGARADAERALALDPAYRAVIR